MKKNVKHTMLIIIGITLIAAAIMLVRHRKAELANLALPLIRPIPVHIRTAISGNLPVTDHYLGTIEPVVEAVLSAQTTGYLIAIHKDVGDRLVAGESVAEIDDRLPGNQKSALEAELAGAREELEVKKKMLNRRKELSKNKVIPRESLDEANLAYELAFSRVGRLKQELEAANVSLSFSRIRSLFDGVVTERMKDFGDMVMPGTPVLRIEDTQQGYKVLVHVPQETATRISPDMPLQLIQGVNAMGAVNAMDAVVYRIHPAITVGNLATVEIRVSRRPFGLPTYGTVGVDLIIEVPRGLVVSSDCILEQETGSLVFEIQENQSIRPVFVQILGRNHDQAVIEGDISSGSKLAAGPESMLLQVSRHGRIVPIFGEDK
ncbi:MAG: efflux RND transporter periplasmic adaptor subunit [Desulfobacteraceae bacterium]|nr:efflux RND transporter periplasmic adaptor subunit [Desulfobacteraceae bacterium]